MATNIMYKIDDLTLENIQKRSASSPEIAHVLNISKQMNLSDEQTLISIVLWLDDMRQYAEMQENMDLAEFIRNSTHMQVAEMIRKVNRGFAE